MVGRWLAVWSSAGSNWLSWQCLDPHSLTRGHAGASQTRLEIVSLTQSPEGMQEAAIPFRTMESLHLSSSNTSNVWKCLDPHSVITQRTWRNQRTWRSQQDLLDQWNPCLCFLANKQCLEVSRSTLTRSACVHSQHKRCLQVARSSLSHQTTQRSKQDLLEQWTLHCFCRHERTQRSQQDLLEQLCLLVTQTMFGSRSSLSHQRRSTGPSMSSNN